MNFCRAVGALFSYASDKVFDSPAFPHGEAEFANGKSEDRKLVALHTECRTIFDTSVQTNLMSCIRVSTRTQLVRAYLKIFYSGIT